MQQKVQIIKKVKDQLVNGCTARHRVIWGGRGKGASWSIARVLLTEGMKTELFIVCVREVQKSIQHSVQKLLNDTIKELHWEWFYKVNKTEIVGINGTKFIFSGLHEHNSDSIKSLEGADRCWVAEAQSISRASIDILRPPIRKDGAVIWWDFNPRYSSDPVYVDYIRNTDKDAKTLFLCHPDNKWFPKSLKSEMEADFARDEDRAKHIWKGALADANELYACPAALVEEAQQRKIQFPLPGVPVVGADIAHQGGDEIVFYKQISGVVVDEYISKKQDADITLQDLKTFAGRNSIINIDNGHLGCAIADFMAKDGYVVNRISFGGTPKDTEHYDDIATEMYFDFKDKCCTADIPIDEELAIQLYTRKYMYLTGKRGNEIMRIESTKDWALHTHSLRKSPDRASGLILAYYEPYGSQKMGGIAQNMSTYGKR